MISLSDESLEKFPSNWCTGLGYDQVEQEVLLEQTYYFSNSIRVLVHCTPNLTLRYSLHLYELSSNTGIIHEPLQSSLSITILSYTYCDNRITLKTAR